MVSKPNTKDDEMYEGGEGEAVQEEDINAHLRGQEDEMAGEENEESTDEELDAEGGDDAAKEKRQRKRMKPVVDWRES